MNINIRINCDNAAFEENASAEVARILRELADDLSSLDISKSNTRRLLDINGNTVGSVVIK